MHFYAIRNIILPSDHLHMHQTVIISIMIMRPPPHIRSKEHLGVIRCKALQKNALYGGIPIWLLSITHSCIELQFSPHPFLRLSVSVCISLSRLTLPHLSSKNNVVHCTC